MNVVKPSLVVCNNENVSTKQSYENINRNQKHFLLKKKNNLNSFEGNFFFTNVNTGLLNELLLIVQ